MLFVCFGLVEGFVWFVDCVYVVGIGVFVDWVFVYFLNDVYGFV